MGKLQLEYHLKSDESYFEYYLKILSCFKLKPLRKREMDILIEFYNLGGLVNEVTRKKVCEGKNMINLNLNNYISILHKAGYLVALEDKNTYQLSPTLMTVLPSDSQLKVEVILHGV